MADSTSAETASLSYEQARDELVQVVGRLEQGGTTLEESLQLWERGEALAARCEEWLLGARKRLEAARAGASTDGSSADTTLDERSQDAQARSGEGAD